MEDHKPSKKHSRVTLKIVADHIGKHARLLLDKHDVAENTKP